MHQVLMRRKISAPEGNQGMQQYSRHLLLLLLRVFFFMASQRKCINFVTYISYVFFPTSRKWLSFRIWESKENSILTGTTTTASVEYKEEKTTITWLIFVRKLIPYSVMYARRRIQLIWLFFPEKMLSGKFSRGSFSCFHYPSRNPSQSLVTYNKNTGNHRQVQLTRTPSLSANVSHVFSGIFLYTWAQIRSLLLETFLHAKIQSCIYYIYCI